MKSNHSACHSANCYARSKRNEFVENTRPVNRSSADKPDIFNNNARGVRRVPCIFCKGNHCNDDCDK